MDWREMNFSMKIDLSTDRFIEGSSDVARGTWIIETWNEPEGGIFCKMIQHVGTIKSSTVVRELEFSWKDSFEVNDFQVIRFPILSFKYVHTERIIIISLHPCVYIRACVSVFKWTRWLCDPMRECGYFSSRIMERRKVFFHLFSSRQPKRTI